MEYKINNCKYNIKEFIKKILNDDFNIYNWDDWLNKQDYDKLQLEPNRLIFVEDNNKLIGTCGIRLISNSECYINSFYVIESYRNKGIGTKLFNMILEYIDSIGINRMYLCVDERFTIAKRMYEKYGFKMYKKNLINKELWYVKKNNN